MIAFSIAAIVASEYTKISAGLIAGSAIVRAWFNKEIAAGKALLARIKATTEAEIAKAEVDLKKIGVEIVTEAKKVEAAVVADVKKI